MAGYEERPTSPCGRIMWMIAVWIFVGPVLFGLTLLLQWWSLAVIVPAVLVSRRYLNEGGMAGAVDRLSRAEALAVRPGNTGKR